MGNKITSNQGDFEILSVRITGSIPSKHSRQMFEGSDQVLFFKSENTGMIWLRTDNILQVSNSKTQEKMQKTRRQIKKWIHKWPKTVVGSASHSVLASLF